MYIPVNGSHGPSKQASKFLRASESGFCTPPGWVKESSWFIPPAWDSGVWGLRFRGRVSVIVVAFSGLEETRQYETIFFVKPTLHNRSPKTPKQRSMYHWRHRNKFWKVWVPSCQVRIEKLLHLFGLYLWACKSAAISYEASSFTDKSRKLGRGFPKLGVLSWGLQG